MKVLILTLIVSCMFSSNLFALEYKFTGQDYPPFNFIENGKPSGAMTEIIYAICAITKDSCGMDIMPLKRIVILLKSGEIHAVSGLIKNSERDEFANFLPTIFNSVIIYASLNTTPPMSTVKGLKGWIIGAIENAASAKMAKQHVINAGGGAKVIEEPDNETLLKKMSNGRYGKKGAIIINENVFIYLTKKHAITNLKKLFVAKVDNFGIYFSKTSISPTELKKFQSAFEKIKKNGTLKKILIKYKFSTGKLN